MYYQTSGKTPSQATIKRRELGMIPQRLKGHPEQDALYRGYKRQLEDLDQVLGRWFENQGRSTTKTESPKSSRTEKEITTHAFVDIQVKVLYF